MTLTTSFYDDLEESLILADLGVDTAAEGRGAAAATGEEGASQDAG